MLTPEELRNVSDADLDSLAEGVEKELHRRKRRRTREVVKQAKQMLAAAGFDVQLFPLGGAPEKTVQKPQKPKQHIPPGLYRDPESGSEWEAGKPGRAPLWITQLQDRGEDLSKYLVEEDESAA